MRPEHWLYTIPLRLRSLFRWSQADRDLDDELRDHLGRATKEYPGKGVAPEEARPRALLDVGRREKVKEECRDARGVSAVDSLIRDIRFSIRQIRRNPGFTFVIVLTLALGMGANTTIFSVLQTVLLRPLPYRDADRLVTVWQKNKALQQLDKVTVADYNDWKTQNHVFDDLAFSWDATYTLTDFGDPQTVIGYQFSENFFSLLGVRPLLGRTFTHEEGTTGRDHVAVLSYHLWQSRFGSDKNILGHAIKLDGRPYEVIGVMPPEFAHPSATEDLWTPLPLPVELLDNRGFHVIQVIARLRAGVSRTQAQLELESLAEVNARLYPQTSKDWIVELDPIRDTYTGNVRPALLILEASVLLLLIIACANVGNMLLARAGTQQREVAVRLALGANRSQLFRQFLIQGLALAAIGAATGLLLAWWGVQGLALLFKARLANLPLPARASEWLNWWALLFTLGITAMTSLMFGAIPAFHRERMSLDALRASGRATDRRSALIFRRSLIVGQIGLSLLLLVGSGLLIRTFLSLQSRSMGFETDHVLTCVLSLSPDRYPNVSKVGVFLEQVLAGVRVIPGVESGGAINTLPLSGMDARRPFRVPGAPDDSGQENVVQFRVVTPDYFRTLQIPLRKGRFFDEHDRASSPLVAIINEKLARRLWPNADPIGQRILVPDTAAPLLTEVVGVVGDVRHSGLASDPPVEIYRPAYQTYWPFYGVVVRTSLDSGRAANAIRQAVWSADKDQPVDSVRSMSTLTADSIALRRSSMLMLSVFAGLSLLLAFLGIYSLIFYIVILRTHEIGVRIALGARQRDIMKSVVGQTALLAFTGIAVGLVAALNLTKFLSSLLFGVTSTDPQTLLMAIVVMMIIAAGAAYVPAHRAARIDPMVALRYE